MELNTAEKRRSGFVGLWISFFGYLGFGKSHENFQKAYLNLKKNIILEFGYNFEY